jgi:tetratricopeptide (TPR) repeat protein
LALQIDRNIGDKIGEASCYANLGIAYKRLGDVEKAIECQNEALQLQIEIGDCEGEAICYTNLGSTYYKIRDFDKAFEYYRKAFEMTKSIDGRIHSSFNLGLLLYKIGNFQLSYDVFKYSIEISEVTGEELIEEEQKIGFYSLQVKAYQYMIPICLWLNKKEETYNYTQRSKSKVFLDMLAATKIRPSDILAEYDLLLTEEAIYLAKLQVNQMRRGKYDTVIEIEDIDSILEQLNNIYSQMEKIDPEYVFMRRGKSLSFKQMKEVLSM